MGLVLALKLTREEDQQPLRALILLPTQVERFLRLVGEYDGQFRDALRDDSRTDLPIAILDPGTGVYVPALRQSTGTLRVDALFSYQPTPGTVLFLGAWWSGGRLIQATQELADTSLSLRGTQSLYSVSREIARVAVRATDVDELAEHGLCGTPSQVVDKLAAFAAAASRSSRARSRHSSATVPAPTASVGASSSSQAANKNV